MTTKGFDAAMACLNDAKQHALDAACSRLAADINEVLHKYVVPTKCRTCGQTIPAVTQKWHTQPCDAGAEERKA